MSASDLKKALRLYKQYKVTSAEYRQLAEKYGMQITDLNQLCWRATHQK